MNRNITITWNRSIGVISRLMWWVLDTSCRRIRSSFVLRVTWLEFILSMWGWGWVILTIYHFLIICTSLWRHLRDIAKSISIPNILKFRKIKYALMILEMLKYGSMLIYPSTTPTLTMATSLKNKEDRRTWSRCSLTLLEIILTQKLSHPLPSGIEYIMQRVFRSKERDEGEEIRIGQGYGVELC